MQLGSLLRDAVADLAEANIKLKPSSASGLGGSSSRHGLHAGNNMHVKNKRHPPEGEVGAPPALDMVLQPLLPVPIVTVSGAMPAEWLSPAIQPQRHGMSKGEEMSDLLNGFKL